MGPPSTQEPPSIQHSRPRVRGNMEETRRCAESARQYESEVQGKRKTSRKRGRLSWKPPRLLLGALSSTDQTASVSVGLRGPVCPQAAPRERGQVGLLLNTRRCFISLPSCPEPRVFTHELQQMPRSAKARPVQGPRTASGKRGAESHKKWLFAGRGSQALEFTRG